MYPGNYGAIPAGTLLANGRSMSASFAIPQSQLQTLATTSYTQSDINGSLQCNITTHVTHQNGQLTTLARRSTLAGDTLLQLNSSASMHGLLAVSISASAISLFSGPTASIDIGDDGVTEASLSGLASWQSNVSISPGITVRIATSASTILFGSFSIMAHSFDVRFTPNVTLVGSGSPTLAGPPIINASGGAPRIGNNSFAITGSNFPASGLVAMLLTAGPTIPAPGFAVPDAQPGCNLHVGLPHDVCAVMAADASGKATFPLGIPADPYLVGLQVGTQWLAADLSLAYPLAIGSSPALSIRISN